MTFQLETLVESLKLETLNHSRSVYHFAHPYRYYVIVKTIQRWLRLADSMTRPLRMKTIATGSFDDPTSADVVEIYVTAQRTYSGGSDGSE
jgi:hypothetical protein